MDSLARLKGLIRDNDRREKPAIPELPKTTGELNALLEKGFITLRQGPSVDESGGITTIELEAECPFCKMQFARVMRVGCFMNDVFPPTCPNCLFPKNVLAKIFLVHPIIH